MWPLIRQEKRAKYLSRFSRTPKDGNSSRMTRQKTYWLLNFVVKTCRLVSRRLSHYRKEFQETIDKIGNGLEKHLDTPIEFLWRTKTGIESFNGDSQTPWAVAFGWAYSSAWPKTSVALMSLTDEFVNRDQLTALMITHHMEDALKYGNRLIVMKDGQ